MIVQHNHEMCTTQIVSDIIVNRVQNVNSVNKYNLGWSLVTERLFTNFLWGIYFSVYRYIPIFIFNTSFFSFSYYRSLYCYSWWEKHLCLYKSVQSILRLFRRVYVDFQYRLGSLRFRPVLKLGLHFPQCWLVDH